MRIVVISPSFYPATYYGGPIYSIYELSKALKKTCTDVRVITTNANGNEKLRVKTGVFHKLENELPVKYYKALDSRGTSLSMLFNLRKEIKNAEIVYLVSIFSSPTPFTIFLCRLYKKPLIISPHGQLGEWSLAQGSIFKKLWLRLFILSRRSPVYRTKPDSVSAKLKTKPEQLVSAKPDLSGEDGPITQPVPAKRSEDGSTNLSAEARSAKEDQSFYWHLTSVQEQQDVLAVYPNAKTFVIPNGVSSELFSLNDKAKDRAFYNKYTRFDCSNKKVIISMGRLQKVKGFDILIEAIGKIGEKKKKDWMIDKIGMIDKPDIVLLIAGEDFGERKKLEEMIDKLGLREKVFLIGRIEGSEKIEFLRNADVFALASHHENFGMVYAEALAAGTPVVASTNTPWQDIEKHNCGLWVENNPDIFAEAITEILNSDPVQIGKNGSKYVEDNFSWEKIGNQFKEVVKTIL